jgi:very-short-patch-repair endonuclease
VNSLPLDFSQYVSEGLLFTRVELVPMDEEGRYEPAVVFARRLRKQATTPEANLWQRLKRSQTGFKFSRQVPILSYTVDFCCRSRRLVVELDGEAHAGWEDWDSMRDKHLRAEGYRVIRFSNEDVFHRLDEVLAKICRACDARPAFRY